MTGSRSARKITLTNSPSVPRWVSPMPSARRTSPRGPSAPTTNRARHPLRARRSRGRAASACTPSARSTSSTSSTPNRTSPPSSRRWSSSTGSMWSCGTQAGSAGLTASTARGSVGKPSGSPSASAVAQRRRHRAQRPHAQLARADRVVEAPGAEDLHRPGADAGGAREDRRAGCRSTTSTRAPLRAAVMAVASPAGPAPMMRMSCVMATTIGDRAPRQLRADYGVRAPAAVPGSRNPSWPAGSRRASRPCAGRGRAARRPRRC